MDKKAFIQNIFLAYRPPREKWPAAVDYGEAAWEYLTQRGYGAAKPGTEKKAEDYYSKLLPDQKDGFDKFWQAFRKKDGKQRAVKAYLQINPTQQQMIAIIRGAEHEARVRNDRGTTPPWAELWLRERRWEDVPHETKKEQRPSEAAGDLAHARSMLDHFESTGDLRSAQYWADQIRRAENAQNDNLER